MQRRSLLRLGLASSLVLAAGGGAALWLAPAGLVHGRLGDGGRQVFAAVGRAVLDQTLPPAGAPRQAALDGLLRRVDTLVAALPPHAQAELSQLLSLLATAGGRRSLAGLQAPWADAPVADLQAALQGMRTSRLALRQQAYAALHDITAGAYFADEAQWPVLGYPGPMTI